ncbi:SGNH/GDSL hydrolase family protein [Paenibacillus sp. NPDC058174]|uniref:SGNH/GDSL hydrolase family protein n=1 Tax=Paenibacillus sp. NPDC058174 TaxID=3346366 RepID=UPI0036DCE464
MTLIQTNAKVLFQGDSITDAGRDRDNASHLGNGYVHIIAEKFARLYPDHNVTFLNRGISGDRVPDLTRRWDEDCLDLKPDWLSIYVGINDTWRRYDNNDPTSTENYYEGYRKLILRTKENSDASLILIEPFVLPNTEDRHAWREDLDPKIYAVRELAREFRTLYVPIDGLFAAASTQSPISELASDGVHPDRLGQELIANAWLNAVQANG